MIRLLNASFPGNFFYMDDVMKFSNKTMGPEFLDNNYKASFVEQEIGFRKNQQTFLDFLFFKQN